MVMPFYWDGRGSHCCRGQGSGNRGTCGPVLGIWMAVMVRQLEVQVPNSVERSEVAISMAGCGHVALTEAWPCDRGLAKEEESVSSTEGVGPLDQCGDF